LLRSKEYNPQPTLVSNTSDNKDIPISNMTIEKVDENATPLTTGEPTTDTTVPSGIFNEASSGGPIVVQGDEYVQHGAVARQSHECCGCCCDTRRAVIIVNIISMTFAVLAIVSISMMTSEGYAEQFDDDEMQAALDELDGKAIGMTIGFAVVGMICNAVGLYGATKYNNLGIIVASIWFAAEFVKSLVVYDIGGAIMAGFFLYPHVVFYQEMKKGIMTPVNYPNEESCCKC
jgi:hypothetical protein